MKIRLKDIIDLEYLISMDDALESKLDIESLAVRDREIFDQCKSRSSNRKELLLSWLSIRKKQFIKEQKETAFLPGTLFALFYRRLLYVMLILGGLTGMMTITSFLAYHGTHPINVMVFTGVFIVLPVILILANFLIWIKNGFKPPVLPHMTTGVFLNGIPMILKKFKLDALEKLIESLEYILNLMQEKGREFKPLFFWPFFILTSVFAWGFSAGTLVGTFLKVVVSDMAFGWQSTVVTGAHTFYHAVRTFAFPWAWILPESIGYPSLDQIEGSRIVLKDGIMALATQDLVSWWPFLCLGILFYALIPRAGLIVIGAIAQIRQLDAFDFEKSRFSQLTLRMQSQVLKVDTQSEPTRHPREKQVQPSRPQERKTPVEKGIKNRAVVLLSDTAFDCASTEKIAQYVKEQMFLEIESIVPVCFDFESDSKLLPDIGDSKPDQVILVYEVWQPPIRGILFYMKQLSRFLAKETSLCLLLTQDAGLKELAVDKNNVDLEIWEKAVAKMTDLDIVIKRFL